MPRVSSPTLFASVERGVFDPFDLACPEENFSLYLLPFVVPLARFVNLLMLASLRTGSGQSSQIRAALRLSLQQH